MTIAEPDRPRLEQKPKKERVSSAAPVRSKKPQMSHSREEEEETKDTGDLSPLASRQMTRDSQQSQQQLKKKSIVVS